MAPPMELDEARRAILDTPGHLMILGGPGCGKTTIALLKARRALDTLQDEQRVVFLSFSRAAVRQVSDRMAGLIGRQAQRRLEVRTFHAFFMDIVRAHGRLLTGRQPSFITPDREAQLRAGFEGDWPTEKKRLAREEGKYAFDELAGAAAELLERSAAVCDLYSSVYPVVVVDEFQDTNIDQWRTVKALSTASTVVCLADPDQRIFDWVEGVDEHRLTEAEDHLSPQTFDLSKDNHRSPGGGLLDYANAVLHNRRHPRPNSVLNVFYDHRWSQPQVFAHYALVGLRQRLEGELGRTPTIAILSRANQMLASISLALDTPRTVRGIELPAVEHTLQWDPELSAAAGCVVASIMEWPGFSCGEAVAHTGSALADLYRVKLASGTMGARKTISTLENGMAAFAAGKNVRAKAISSIAAAHEARVSFTGQPVADWEQARSRLRDAAELDEARKHARMLRLLKATDALARGLTDAWDGQGAYQDAAATVRSILAVESLTAHQQPTEAVSLMSMHRSKGKEFDGVVIVEGVHQGRLLDPRWDTAKSLAERRLLRVAITRARSTVVFVRPDDCMPLCPP
jgi:DNA helicase II / ATP-dependent DNA helicase PcrA